MTRRTKIAAVLVAAVTGSAILPIPYTAAPAWEVWVVDETGRPLQGMKVRLSYRNHSVESAGHELDAVTGADGRVFFPLRTDSAPAARYMAQSVRAATVGVHASFGRHATVFAFGQGREGSAAADNLVTDWTGTPPEMKSRIVAHRTLNLQR